MNDSRSALSYDAISRPEQPILAHSPRIDDARRRAMTLFATYPPSETQFSMYERVVRENKDTDFRSGSFNGYGYNAQTTDSDVATAFFSDTNMQVLQSGLRDGVYRMSNQQFSIPPQDPVQLTSIMRGMFYRYAARTAEDRRKPTIGQVEDLNDRVLKYVVPYLYHEAVAYYKFLLDQSSLVTPLALPRQVDRDFKDLDRVTF